MYRIKELQQRIKNFGIMSSSYWGCALIGEIGELANFIKKDERNKLEYHNVEIGKEIADIFIYLELICRHFDYKLTYCIQTAEQYYDSLEFENVSEIILYIGVEIGTISIYMLNSPVCLSMRPNIGKIYLLIKRIAIEYHLDLYTIINDKITEIEERR